MKSPIRYKVFSARDIIIEKQMNEWLDELFKDNKKVFDIRETRVTNTVGGYVVVVILYEVSEIGETTS